jgi:hypothetical protein
LHGFFAECVATETPGLTYGGGSTMRALIAEACVAMYFSAQDLVADDKKLIFW